jgi:hypothetical protein
MREKSRRVRDSDQDTERSAASEEPGRERFGAGELPPVHDAFAEPAGTADLAFAEDENERELKHKVAALVASKYGGDFKQAFAHYDSDGDGGISKGELVDLLADAGVGNAFTRGVWANKILDRIDTSHDRKIQWREFDVLFSATA